MKKIKVVTRQNINNHGSILQAIGTQVYFENLGYECEIINYCNEKEKFPRIINEYLKLNDSWNKNIIKRFIYKTVKYISGMPNSNKFNKYRKELLNLTPKYSYEELRKIDFSDSILCSGSDQLWGPIIDGSLEPFYFLAFNNKQPKISFASSVGRSVDYNDEYLGYLNEYKILTVREKSAEIYLRDKINTNVTTILDPTLMIDSEYWKKFANKKTHSEKYLLVYRIHENPEFEALVERIAKDKSLKVYRIANALDDMALYGKTQLNVHPSKFLALIRDAEYVLTDSFHCTVFSLLFKRKFLSISPGKTSVRIKDLLTMVELENRLLNKFDDYSQLDANIDYDNTEKILNDKRVECNNYYVNMLKSL